MPKSKKVPIRKDRGYGELFRTVQVHPAIKQVLAIEKARRVNVTLGELVTELVVARYGDEPEYRRILQAAGLITTEEK